MPFYSFSSPVSQLQNAPTRVNNSNSFSYASWTIFILKNYDTLRLQPSFFVSHKVDASPENRNKNYYICMWYSDNVEDQKD